MGNGVSSMQRSFVTRGRGTAMFAVLAAILAPHARAQRVESEVQEVDSTANVRLPEQVRNQSPTPRTSDKPAPRSTWTGSATQPSRNLIPAVRAVAPQTSSQMHDSTESRVLVTTPDAKTLSPSFRRGQSTPSEPSTSRRTLTSSSLPRTGFTTGSSHSRTSRKKPSAKSQENRQP
jgi:hypothetical protein